ncbi:MAG: ATP-binding cassette domain-containing protein [Ruminococcaceae bacterium]|nr:ATP-binding cassette domain-containing protein [Oscillospiraceae bacterium]
MDMLVNIPGEVLGYIENNKGIPVSEMLIGLSCRGNMPASGNIYLLADEQTLNVLEGVSAVDNSMRSVFTETGFSSYKLCDIESFDIEEIISGVRLSIRLKNESNALICESSNTFKEPLSLFAGYLRLIQIGEFNGVDEADKEALCPGCGRRFPDANKICPYCADKSGVVKRLIPFLKRYMKEMLTILALMGLISAVGVITPYLGNSFYIDKVLTEGGEFYGMVTLVISLLIAMRLVSFAVTILNDIVTAKISANIVYDLKNMIFEAINRLSLSFFNSRRTGGLMTQIESDSNTLYSFFSEMVPNLVVAFVKIFAITVVMLMMNPLLALITVIIVPLYVLMVTRAFKRNRRFWRVFFIKSRALNGKLTDVLSGLRIVKVFAKEKEESEEFKKLSYGKMKSKRDRDMYAAIVFPAISFVLYLGTVAVWAIGGITVIRGEMSYGDLLTFVSYMGLVYNPLNYIINSVNRMSECFNAASRLFEISDAIPDVVESQNPVHIENIKGEIEFKNVSFSYTKAKKTIDSISFRVEAGKTLGIVGRTGAGKSTIVNLLTRLYDVTGGEVLIDGVNVRDMSFKQLRDSVAIVSQETYLFSGTIFENIAYSMKNATHEEVVEAAIQAGAHDFIMRLPDAYETRIGYGHKDLSGGERQRISIARALLKKPKILILDEATAAMDTATEKKIENAIERLSGSCTTIMIAHRLSTLKSADSLIVIENGKLYEEGTHTQLLEKEGIYHKLYTLQLEALRNIISDDGDEENKHEKMPGAGPRQRRRSAGASI